MAIITVSNTGGNWNATATWVGGVVPLSTDTVIFTALSGQVTVNVVSTCAGINFTTYVNTITFTALLTVNGAVNLGTGGYTQAGASGIQVTTTATLTSGGVTWSRLWTFAGSTQTYTLADNWNFTGTLNFSGSGTNTLTSNTINTINLTVTTIGTFSGTTNIVFNGTGTWSASAAGYIQNNITINTSGTLTIGTNIYYNTGTLTYTAGTVTTTGSTLNLSASTTLNTNGITWNNINTSNTLTLTLSSNLNTTNLYQLGILSFTLGGNNLSISGTLSLANGSTSTSLNVPQNLQVTNLLLGNGFSSYHTLNGVFTISVSGNLTQNQGNGISSGTASILLNGTGTWSNASTGALQNNLTINTSGTLTIGTNIYYNTGTLTYTAGTVDTTTNNSTLNISASTTLNTNGIFWNNITITAGTQTLTSDLNCQNLTAATNTINGLFNVNVSGNITASGLVQGTSTIVLIGTGLWTALNGSNCFRTPVIINTNGIITLANSLCHDGNLTFTNGVVISKNTTINFGSTLKTLTNLHKIVFKNIILDVGITTTMNEFFSGSPELVTNISSSTTANYIIAFQDRFEKISKFVNITNCTLSNPQQLLVITNSLRSSTNKGIRYINQSPNGIAKGDATILNTMTASAGGYVKDPNMK
jgi:hypothetical protein